MTILVGQFTDYAALPRDAAFAKYDHCSPTEVLIGAYLDATYGTANLGCFSSERRDNRAGTLISTHSFGAAGDRSFRLIANQTIKRQVMLAAIADLKSKSKEWGIQAIHDYMGCRIWRSNRDPKVYPDGWKIQPVDQYGMGQTWADWIHVEVNAGAWFDTRALQDRLDGPINPPVVVRPVIGMGSHGPLVKAVQTWLAKPSPGPNQASIVGNADGNWGPRTQLAWSNYVMWEAMAHPGAMTTDGNVDGVDWNMIAWNDGGWGNLYAAGFPQGI